MQYLGEILSVVAAILWAFAVILFKKSGESVHPIALNLFKNIFAMALFIATILILDIQFIQDLSTTFYLYLFLSGVIGIGVGDTLFLKSLNLLGAGLTGIVYCLYAPFVIIFSVLLLNETLTILQVFGVFLIVLAILIATYKRGKSQIKRERILLGILLAIFANIAFATGIVIIKPLLGHTPILWATLVRLIGGIFSLFIILIFLPERRKIIKSLTIRSSFPYTISGSFIGTYLAMLVWLAGIKYTQVSIASTLNQTNTIFIFLFAAIILKEPIDWKRSTGVLLAILGVALVTLG